MIATTDKAIKILETSLYGSPEDLEEYGAYEYSEAIRAAIRALKAMKLRENEKPREQTERKHDIHNAFAMLQDHLLKLSEELRENSTKLVYREKHKNSEGNIFVSEKERDATQIDNITRALYEIEKSERKLTITVIKDAFPETIPAKITVLKKEDDK